MIIGPQHAGLIFVLRHPKLRVFRKHRNQIFIELPPNAGIEIILLRHDSASEYNHLRIQDVHDIGNPFSEGSARMQSRSPFFASRKIRFPSQSAALPPFLSEILLLKMLAAPSSSKELPRICI